MSAATSECPPGKLVNAGDALSSLHETLSKDALYLGHIGMWDMLTWKPHENGKQLTIINSPNDSSQQGITPSEESKGTLQGMPSSSVEVLEEECVILIAVVQISAQSYFLAADGCLTNPMSRMETIKPSCLLEAPMLCQFNPNFKTVIDNLTWLETLCSTPSLKQQSVVKDDGSMTWIMM
ncbi:hypothetical protein J3A83DRAFT_4187011 [Scleroderma citrinum]